MFRTSQTSFEVFCIANCDLTIKNKKILIHSIFDNDSSVKHDVQMAKSFVKLWELFTQLFLKEKKNKIEDGQKRALWGSIN